MPGALGTCADVLRMACSVPQHATRITFGFCAASGLCYNRTMLRKMGRNTRRRQFDPHWLLLLLLSLVVCAPLTYPGTFQVHSGFLPVYNLYDLEAQHGGLSWAPVVGREFDLLRGEGPLPYFLAEATRWLGAGGVAAVKIIFGLGLVLGALGMYGWTRRVLGDRGAMLAALVYACWPYVLATIYTRGALAEALFLGLLPWTLWALQRLLDGHHWSAALVVVGVALLAWTQPGLALWAALVLLAYGLALHRHRWPLIVAGVLGGLLLGAAGLWPLAAAHGLGRRPIVFSEHFVYPFQLLSAAWGHGVSIPGWQDDFPMQIGLIAVGLAAVAIFLLVTGSTLNRGIDTQGQVSDLPLQAPPWTSLGIALVVTFLTLTWAAPLWRLPGLAQASRTLTYPWQLLTLVGPFLGLLGGSVVTLGLGRMDWGESLPLWAALIALTLLASYGYLQPLTTRYEPGAAPLAVLGENELLLLDAQIEGPLQPVQAVQLCVRWQPLRPLAKDYTVFVHALDETEQRWGQQDTQPKSGEYPTSHWQVGEIIEDCYELHIAADGPPGGYHLILGLYDWQTGDRMRVGDDNKVVIGNTP